MGVLPILWNMTNIIRRGRYRLLLSIFHLVALSSPGCSSLGITLYPAGSFMTEEAERVLEASRVPAAVPRELAKTVLADHSIQPGDVLLIEAMDTARDLRLPADQVVMLDGTVDLGLYGRVKLVGMTLEQAEHQIESQVRLQMRTQRQQRLLALGEPDQPIDEADEKRFNELLCSLAVNVRLVEAVHQYYVLGEVNAPGSFSLRGHETVLDAILEAGGLTSQSNPCQILLSRPTDPCECRITLPVCYREIVQLGNAATNYQIRPGDRIFVASRSCLDELCFWKADRTCPRCEGCNRPCADPSAVHTVSQFAANMPATIPPGSIGFPREPSLIEARSIADDDASSQPIRLGGRDDQGDAWNDDATAAPAGASLPDGELDFDTPDDFGPSTQSPDDFQPMWIQPR